jgi:hypothetical protein
MDDGVSGLEGHAIGYILYQLPVTSFQRPAPDSRFELPAASIEECSLLVKLGAGSWKLVALL